MVDLAGAGKAGWELDPIPPPPLTIPPHVKPEVLISPKYSIMARCGTGTTGRHIQLLANHFKVTVKAIDAVFYQYSVHITGEDKREVKGKGIGRKLVDRLFQTYPSEVAGKKFAYDGEKDLNTVGPLPQNNLEFTVVLEETFAKRCMQKWELDAALDVLTMCSCHLLLSDPIREEVMYKRQALLRYSHILSADDHYSSWQEVEAECKEDPEGLALRLAGMGAVSAALEVAESALIKPEYEPLTDDMAQDEVPIAAIHLDESDNINSPLLTAGATGNQDEEPMAAQGREGRNDIPHLSNEGSMNNEVANILEGLPSNLGESSCLEVAHRFQERLRQRKRSAAIMMLVCLVLLLVFPCGAASDEENQDLIAAQVLKLTAEAELLNAQAVQLRQWNEELEPGNLFLTGLLIIGLVVCGAVAWWCFTWIRLIGKYYWSRRKRRNLRERELEMVQAEEV